MTLLTADIKKLSSIPAEGVFYLVPMPSGETQFYYDRVDEPFTDEWDAMLHFSFFNNVVKNILAQAWKINPDKLTDLYACIPRGRVDKTKNGYAVIHGGDSIVSPFQRALRAFGLTGLWSSSQGGLVKEVIDSAHEVTDPKQVQRLESLIGVKMESI